MVKGQGCLSATMPTGGNTLIFSRGSQSAPSATAIRPSPRRSAARPAELVHVSNLYYTRPQTELAELLVAHSFADKVFLANSGAEANEAAIKLARIHAGEGRYQIISLTGSFHGRTLATVAATGQTEIPQGFRTAARGLCPRPLRRSAGH